jgi:organic hydroperoxide reductase OsmC/OhrA
MHPFPHRYTASAIAAAHDDVLIESDGLPALRSASPPEFDGPGGRWSPETLLAAAVASCFVQTFRAIAKASKFGWTSLTCEAIGTLDRVDHVTQFTGFTIRASLEVGIGVDETYAARLLAKAEQTCLVTNSLKAESRLQTDIRVIAQA